MRSRRSPLLRLWTRFALVFVPVVVVSALISYWLTKVLIVYMPSLRFLGSLLFLVGPALILDSMFVPDLKRLAVEHRRRKRRRAGT